MTKMYVFQLENIDFQIQIFLFSKSRSNLPFRSLWFFFVQTWLQLTPNFAFFTPYLDRIGPQSRFHMLPHGATWSHLGVKSMFKTCFFLPLGKQGDKCIVRKRNNDFFNANIILKPDVGPSWRIFAHLGAILAQLNSSLALLRAILAPS